MSSVQDRIIVITDLLLGAAYADEKLRGAEEEAVRKLLGQLLGVVALPEEVESRIATFASGDFDLSQTAQDFAADPPIRKRKLLELVAAVRDADEEVDLSEDEYLCNLGQALGMDESEYQDLALQYEVEELRGSLDELRASPPPVPKD